MFVCGFWWNVLKFLFHSWIRWTQRRSRRFLWRCLSSWRWRVKRVAFVLAVSSCVGECVRQSVSLHVTWHSASPHFLFHFESRRSAPASSAVSCSTPPEESVVQPCRPRWGSPACCSWSSGSPGQVRVNGGPPVRRNPAERGLMATPWKVTCRAAFCQQQELKGQRMFQRGGKNMRKIFDKKFDLWRKTKSLSVFSELERYVVFLNRKIR